MQCHACGTLDERDATFCKSCGMRLFAGPKSLIEKARDAPIGFRILMDATKKRLEIEHPQLLHLPSWRGFVICGTIGGVMALALRLHFDVVESERTPLELTMRKGLMEAFKNSEHAYQDCYEFITDGLLQIPRSQRGVGIFLLIAIWVIDQVAGDQNVEDKELVVAELAEFYQSETTNYFRHEGQ